MPQFDARSASCHVFTYKEGLLSSVGHDLRLVVTRFTVDVETDPLRVAAHFEASSLRVESAMLNGADVPHLSAFDRQKIERAMVDDVLHARRHPKIRFESQRIAPASDGYEIEGELTLHGVTRPLRLRSAPSGGDQVAEAMLHQPDFGIKPYSALLGALRIQPDLRVRIRVPAAWLGQRS